MDNKIITYETKNGENSEEIQNNNCKTFNKLILKIKLMKFVLIFTKKKLKYIIK